MAEQPIAIIAPDGKVYLVPPDQVAEAHLHGGELALRVEAPGGTQHWVPLSQAVEAQAHGGRFVNQDGSEYKPGTEPVITGLNSAGQPQWGSGPKYLGRNADGFPYYEQPKNGSGFVEGLDSFGDAIAGAAKGVGALLDPRSEAEQGSGALLPGATDAAPYLYPARILGRMIAPQVEQGKAAYRAAEQAHKEGRVFDPVATGHVLAAITPGVGPWAAQVAETISPQIAEGNYAGAGGTLAGNLAVAAVPEIVPRGARVALEASRRRIAEMQAPRSLLDKPIVPGEMSPMERWREAMRMKVNLDRAQATNAPGPRMAKTMTEKSIAGSPQFEANNARNVQALHEHAGSILADAAGPMDRRAFGERVQDALTAHRAQLADEPGHTAAAQRLLDTIHPVNMTGEQFGTAAKAALNKHQRQMYTQAGEKLTDALGSKGAQIGMKGVQDAADKILEGEFDYYKESPESLKLPGIRTTIEQILPKASDEVRQKWNKQFQPEKVQREGPVAPQGASAVPQAPPVSTPANVAKLRSDLMNLYRSPELVGSNAEGWLKQMVQSLDSSLTDPANEAGMSPGQIQKFRAGNSQWERMKQMYDDPQSPFFGILRHPEPKTVAGTLEKLKPAAARQYREAMSDVEKSDMDNMSAADAQKFRAAKGGSDQPELVRQQQRQIANHLLDPTDSGSFDLPGLRNRWAKMNKETAVGLLHPDQMVALGDLADKSTKKTIYDKPRSQLKQVIEALDGTTAAEKMFDNSGKFLLTPEEAATIGEADPKLVPQLQRHAIERLLDPPGNGVTDLRNFAARWDRAQNAPLESLLTPDQMRDLDSLASVSRTVNLPANPSGTATVLQPAAEAGQLARAGSGLAASTAGAITGTTLGGPIGGALGGAAGAVADTVAKGLAAKRLIDPKATRAVMEHTVPAAAVPAAVGALKDTAANLVPGALKAAAAGADQNENGNRGDTTAPVVKPALGPTVATERTGSERDVLASSPDQVQLGDPSVVKGPGTSAEEMNIAAPSGATHEVIHPDGKTVLGHVVDGEYVPLAPPATQ